MGKRNRLMVVGLGCMLSGAGDASADLIYTANLTNDQETTPAVPTTSTGQPRTSNGSATLTINDARTQILITGTVNGIDLTGLQTADPNDNVTAAHIHVGSNFPPASNGVAWGFIGSPFHNTDNDLVVTPFASGAGGTFTGTWDLNEGTSGGLVAHLPLILEGRGRAYLNFHTSQFPGGEIRGAIVPEPGTLGVLSVGALGLLRRRRRG